MQIGNWVPIDKRMKKFLPKTRKYTELEAAFSLTIDYDNQNEVTISGYSKLWGWSRTKVKTFFDQLGIEVIYPDDTISVQKQKGQIKKQKEDRKETEKRQIRFIDSKWLKETKNRKKTEKKQKEDRSKSTTIDPSFKPNPEPILIPFSGADEIFKFWASEMNKPNAKFTEERKNKVKSRLKDGYTIDQIKESITNCSKDPFSQGVNDRNTKFDDLELICRTGKKLESFFSSQKVNTQVQTPKQVFRSGIISESDRQKQIEINKQNSGRIS